MNATNSITLVNEKYISRVTFDTISASTSHSIYTILLKDKPGVRLVSRNNAAFEVHRLAETTSNKWVRNIC